MIGKFKTFGISFENNLFISEIEFLNVHFISGNLKNN